MTGQLLLIQAIRSGRLAEVRAVLDAGAPVELDDGEGDPGLPLGVACFMGFVDIVRELVKRGARANLPDNGVPASPLSMAIRGGRKEVVRVLLELGVDLPAGVQTGLSGQEIMLAQWLAQRNGWRSAAGNVAVDAPDIEEIEVLSCFGIDTQTLEADVLRIASNQC